MAEMARDIGYKFLKRDKNSIIVMINKVKQRIEIVTTFPFSSERKRMSVIIKWKGSHILFTKGVKILIFRLIMLYLQEDQIFNLAYLIQLKDYAKVDFGRFWLLLK